MKRSRFLWRWYLGYVALILLIATIALVLVFRAVKNESYGQAKQSLTDQVFILTNQLHQEPSLNSWYQHLGEISKNTHTRYTVIDHQGWVLFDSQKDPETMDNHKERPELLVATEQEPSSSIRFSQTIERKMLYVALVVKHDGQSYYVRAAQNLSLIDQRMLDLQIVIIIVCLFAVAVAMVLGFIYVRRITKPLGQMTMAAKAISAGDFNKTFLVEREDEIGDLAKAFSTMTGQLKNQIQTVARDQKKLYAILKSLVEGVVAIDQHEVVLHMNEAAARILECDHKKSIGQKLTRVTPVISVHTVLIKAMETEKNKNAELRLGGMGNPMVIEMNASPLRDESNKITGAVVVLHDVTELRRLESVRREFVGNVSHEFKTPVTAIRGLVETMLDDEDMPQNTRERFLDKIKRQSNRLSTLVTDLLTLSRLESQKAEIEKERLDIRTVMQTSFQSMLMPAEAKDISLHLDLPKQLF